MLGSTSGKCSGLKSTTNLTLTSIAISSEVSALNLKRETGILTTLIKVQS